MSQPIGPKTAIVTGASTGIGYAVAKRFLNDGINVVMNARTETDLVKAYDELKEFGNVTYIVGDVSKKETGEKLVSTAVDQFGGVDILINNAGVFQAKPFLDTEEADLDHYFGINFKGSYFTAQAAVPEMKKRGGGAIINVGTTLIEHAIGGFPASAALASKAALHSLSNQLGAELGQIISAYLQSRQELSTPPSMARTILTMQTALAGLHLLNRIGTSEQMADAIAMLAENEFITGTVLRVDGGHSAGHALG